MDISMDIHEKKSVDMDMDMDGKLHIHGKPGNTEPKHPQCFYFEFHIDGRSVSESDNAKSQLGTIVERCPCVG